MKLDKAQKIMLALTLVFALCLGVIGSSFPVKEDATPQYLDTLDLRGIDNIMIVAHPDDESLWGGAHLAKDRYLVVCLTNANTYHLTRYKEFKYAMNVAGSPSIMLDYPDYVNRKRVSWEPYKNRIEKNIRTLLRYKKWKVIATHNPEGEYGHPHHIGTSNIVTSAAKKEHDFDHLYYFGKYYRQLPPERPIGPPEDPKYMKIKKKMFPFYNRERRTIWKHRQMHYFENWVKASDWNEGTKSKTAKGNQP